jgi:hypothetical protein
MVGTGFERDVDGGAGQRAAACLGVTQGHDLGMGATGALGVAAADDLALGVDDDTSDARIRVTHPDGLGRQLECGGHVLIVDGIGRWRRQG